jgi:hypothetical protein
MQVHPTDLSVVVQGPIIRAAPGDAAAPTTADVLASVRAHLPGAQLILSTWRGEDLAGLPCDDLVLSNDPGAIAPNPDFRHRLNNVNRQLVSTAAGLRLATRRHALKLRTDTPLLHARFLQIDRAAQQRHLRWRLLSERVLLPKELSLHPAVVPSLYYGSDVFQFGLAEDLRALWSAPLAPEPQTSRAFDVGSPPPLVYNVVEGPCVRMAPEQYYLVSYLQRRGVRAALSYLCDCSLAQTATSLLFMANNFAFVPAEELGVKLPARIAASPMSRLSAESNAWAKTTARLSGTLSARFWLPIELAAVRLKWLHFWIRYTAKPKWRVHRRNPVPA